MAENPDKFRVVALAAGSNVTLLADQVKWNHLVNLVLTLSSIRRSEHLESVLFLNSLIVA